jgi:hypothetical protein
MKAQVAVKVTLDVAKVITALTGFVVAIAYILRHW